MPQIIPAILTDDLNKLQQQLQKAGQFAKTVQIDFMDGEFVPFTSVTLEGFKEINIPKNLKLEAHLMVKRPEEYFVDLKQLGFQHVIFHFEAVDRFELEEYSDYARKIGLSDVDLALKPETSLDLVEPYLKHFKHLLFLGVTPGQQGQEFQVEVLEKMRRFRQNHPGFAFAVDGGIKLTNIKEILTVGPNRFIIGSAIWESASPVEAYQLFREIIISNQNDKGKKQFT